MVGKILVVKKVYISKDVSQSVRFVRDEGEGTQPVSLHLVMTLLRRNFVSSEILDGLTVANTRFAYVLYGWSVY
jgi:hypothetical protein